MGCFWNHFRAALRNLIAFRHSLSNQGLLRLLVVEFLGTHSFAISINVSVKYSTISWFVSIWVSLFLHFSLNICQLGLSNFQRGAFSLLVSELWIKTGKWLLPHVSSYTFQAKTIQAVGSHILVPTHLVKITQSLIYVNATLLSRHISFSLITFSSILPFLFVSLHPQRVLWLLKSPNRICPVGWGSRIHRLLLCRGVRPHPQRVFWIWH